MSVEQLHQVLEMGTRNPPPASGNPREMRVWFEAMMEPVPAATGVTVTPIDIASLPCEMLSADGAPDGSALRDRLA